MTEFDIHPNLLVKMVWLFLPYMIYYLHLSSCGGYPLDELCLARGWGKHFKEFGLLKEDLLFHIVCLDNIYAGLGKGWKY